MRSIFLFLSHSRILRRWMERSALGKRLSSRFVAGPTVDDALDVCKSLKIHGMNATLDHLGENVTRLNSAAASRDECTRALGPMAAAGVEPNLSIKLTQFGLDVDAVTCYRNVEHLVEAAAARKGFIRIDMESSAYTDRTLALVDDLFTRYGNVGTAIQAYLLRSEQDVEALCQRGIRVRLCKGAYLEPPGIAWEKKEDVDANFIKLMKRLLLDGTYPAIATHDERIIHEARKFVAENKIPASDFEFQMLYGIRRDLQRLLVAQGYRVRVYVPYGRAWFPYFMRRLAERPANALFLAKNLFR